MKFFIWFFMLSGLLFAQTLKISNFVDYIDIEVLKDFGLN